MASLRHAVLFFCFSRSREPCRVKFRRLAPKAPAAGYAMPAGEAGTTVDVRLSGYDWTPDVQFLL